MEKIAECIRNGSIRNVTILGGAGMSMAAGLPDFRSPGGLYDTLRPDLLTTKDEIKRAMEFDPTLVVDRAVFEYNQFPYLEVRRPFITGIAERKWKPTISHCLAKLMHDHGVLRRLYQQNIDGLDYDPALNIPQDKMVSCHGTMGKCQCEFCAAPFPLDEFTQLVRNNIKDIYNIDPEAPTESSPIVCPTCGRAGLKPATVLYGSNLPAEFFECREMDMNSSPETDTDLLIVIGTSLTVSPANQLVTMVSHTTPRLLINRDPVGTSLGLDFASDRDTFCCGDADQGVLDFVRLLGWEDDLKKLAPILCENSSKLLM